MRKKESEKSSRKIWREYKKALLLHSQLSHGVMVALQILVLPAVVRVHLGQQNKAIITIALFYFCLKLLII